MSPSSVQAQTRAVKLASRSRTARHAVERVDDKAKPQPGGATRGAQTRKGGGRSRIPAEDQLMELTRLKFSTFAASCLANGKTCT